MIYVMSHLRCRDHVLGIKSWSNLPIKNIRWSTALINFCIDNMNVGSSNILWKVMFIFLKKMFIFYFWDLMLDVWMWDLVSFFRPRSINVSIIILSFQLLFRNTFRRRFLHSIKSLHIYITSGIIAYCLREHGEATFEFLLSSKFIIKDRDMSGGSATTVLRFVRVFIELFVSVFLEADLAKSSCHCNKLSFLCIFLRS